jgi:hypothetical protein
VILRTLRFPEIKTCEPSEELGRWLYGGKIHRLDTLLYIRYIKTK